MPAPSAPVGACVLLAGIGPVSKATSAGRENIKLYGSILGTTDREVTRALEDIIAFSELGEFFRSTHSDLFRQA